MSTPNPRRRIAVAAAIRKPVKLTFCIPAELHIRVAAAAAMRGVSKTAFAIEAFQAATRGIVVSDRSREAPPSPTDLSLEDRQAEAA